MEWSRDNRRQRAGKGLKDSNLGAGSTKLFRASGFHLLASWALRRPVRFGAGAARKWDREFESGFLHRRVQCEPDFLDHVDADALTVISCLTTLGSSTSQ
jgi:hypothetical protein